jgi:hypothetical protein
MVDIATDTRRLQSILRFWSLNRQQASLSTPELYMDFLQQNYDTDCGTTSFQVIDLQGQDRCIAAALIKASLLTETEVYVATIEGWNKELFRTSLEKMMSAGLLAKENQSHPKQFTI